MPTYYSIGTQSLPLTTIQRELHLPVPGAVLVQPGDGVEAGDAIARCELPGKVWVADVSQALGINRERVVQYVKQNVGDLVQANDVLAERESRFGWPSRRCQAAVNGQVVAIRHGAVLVEAQATTLELCSQITGRVTDVVPERGAVICAVGALIQGMWGSGGETTGILRVLVDEPDRPLTAESFETDYPSNCPGSSHDCCRQVLAVGGTIEDKEVLEKAVAAQIAGGPCRRPRIAGLVVGSVDAGLRQQLEELPCPVLVTEGFGALAMRPEAFTLFQANEGHSATITAGCQSRLESGSPEVFIPLDAAQDVVPQDPDPRPVQVGMRIRGLRAPYQGAVGTVLELPASPQRVDSGIKLPVAAVELDGGELVAIPLANLEVVR